MDFGTRWAFFVAGRVPLQSPQHPDHVTWITDQVAITNFFSAHNKEILAENGIRAVLCLDRDLQGDSPAARGIECLRLVHMIDGPNETVVFKEAVDALEELILEHGRVVVHCRAGRSRSIAVAAAYLMKSLKMEASDALEAVMAKRPCSVAPELIRLVEEFDPGHDIP